MRSIRRPPPCSCRRRPRDQRLAPGPEAVGEDPAPLGVELREHVVEQEQRSDAATLLQQLGLPEQEREHSKALLALRAEGAQVALAGEDSDVVEVGTEAGCATLEVAVGAVLQLLHGRRRPLVTKFRLLEPEFARTLGEARLKCSDRLVPPCHELRTQPAHLLVPRRERLPR